MNTNVVSIPSDQTPVSLLLETAQAHQQLADHTLSRLEAHAQGLDAVVRDEIRRSFITECGALIQEAHRAVDAFEHARESAGRKVLWSVLLSTGLVAGGGLGVLSKTLPSFAQLQSLRAERQQLLAATQQLTQVGGRIQLRRCGSKQRLCVRVDRATPAYGEAADYLVLKGY